MMSFPATTFNPLNVVIVGAGGRMGKQATATVLNTPGLQLVAVVDPKFTSHALAEATLECVLPSSVMLGTKLTTVLNVLQTSANSPVQVGLELTRPSSVFANTLAFIKAGLSPVVGATGLTPVQEKELEQALLAQGLPGAIIPNFSIGAVLLMEFAAKASRYFANAEVIELHHNQKADAPSGTATLTVQRMQEARTGLSGFGADNAPETETWEGARGAALNENQRLSEGLRVHSVRLPGLVAHQEVLFGAPGQLLTLRHDSFDRSCFMPGIVTAIENVVKQPPGLLVGLEHLL